MGGKSLGPSVVLFPVRTSTTHDELLCWQVVPPCAPPSTIISELHDGIDLSSLLQTAAILGFGGMGLNPYDGPIGDDPNATTLAFGGMGLTPFGGQQTLNLIWPISRVEWLPPNASFVLKLSEIGLISNHRHCDAAHASTLLCDITSLNLCTITLTHTAPCLLLGDASQPSWICWIKPLWLARSTFSSKLFKPPNLSLLIRRLSAFWTCNLLCRMYQAYSSKEIPSLKPYSSNEISSLNFEPENKPQTAASSMEHFNESSYASIARAHYDHKLIQDF
ncbi:unnamed protein product [Arabidopsis thaliana]|uniref:Uncharacterized protein n=1 Tax=Arabidopsis thaliana TaxID=3702 RepID=A0A5S9WJ73_ARATH|nr:unnamed protein product [Arabidopsis thaliana]